MSCPFFLCPPHPSHSSVFLFINLSPSENQALGREPNSCLWGTRNQFCSHSMLALFPLGFPLLDHTLPKTSPLWNCTYPWIFKIGVCKNVFFLSLTFHIFSKNLRTSKCIYSCPIPLSSLTCFLIMILTKITKRAGMTFFFSAYYVWVYDFLTLPQLGKTSSTISILWIRKEQQHEIYVLNKFVNAQYSTLTIGCVA